MFIGVYLCLSGFAWLVALAVFGPARRRIGRFSAVAAGLAGTGLVLFILLSLWLGLVRFGSPYNLSIPQDYYARGAAGIGALVVGAAGVVSPLFAVMWLKGGKGRNNAEL